MNNDGSTTMYGGMLNEVVISSNHSSGGYGYSSSGGFFSNGFLNDPYFMNSQFWDGSGYGILANAAAAGVTIYDAVTEGLQTHHVADLFVQAVIYDIALGVPVAGWIVGGAYFIGDEYFKNTHNGMSITEYYLN